jgi:hypothetical protein
MDSEIITKPDGDSVNEISKPVKWRASYKKKIEFGEITHPNKY